MNKEQQKRALLVLGRIVLFLIRVLTGSPLAARKDNVRNAQEPAEGTRKV
jgi:hypothetical protein